MPPFPPKPTNPADWPNWFTELYNLVGKSTGVFTGSVAGTSSNITGLLASANAVANMVKNASNNATVSWADTDASGGVVSVFGPSGAGSDWERYEGGDGETIRTLGPYGAAMFTGKAYNTVHYVAFNTASYLCTTDYTETLPDGYFYVGSVKANAAFGGAGATSGGGGTASGSRGGADYTGFQGGRGTFI